MGEAARKAMAGQKGAIALDTVGRRIHVEWDPAAAVTPLGQLPFFIEFLKVSGLFLAWVADCPLAYHSNRASDTRTVLATLLLSILAGYHRDAQMLAIRHDRHPPGVFGCCRIRLGGYGATGACPDGRIVGRGLARSTPGEDDTPVADDAVDAGSGYHSVSAVIQ